MTQSADPPNSSAGAIRACRAHWGVVLLGASLRITTAMLLVRVAMQQTGSPILLDDEAGYHWASTHLLPNPLDARLPSGQVHLGGNSFLGLTTTLYVLFGPDPTILRLANALLGTLIVAVSMRVASQLLGKPRAVVAGLGLACWPPLVLWSATVLRDTLVSLCLVAVWWAISALSTTHRLRALGVVVLALYLLLGLRPYVCGLAALGVALWAAGPLVRRTGRIGAVPAAVPLALLIVALTVYQARWLDIDYVAKEVMYRQTVTRLEVLGALHGMAKDGTGGALRPGALVAWPDRPDGHLLLGVIHEHAGWDTEVVAFTDGTRRYVPRQELQPFSAAKIPPGQIFEYLAPSLVSVFFGESAVSLSGPTRYAWIADALAWDILLVLAVLGLRRCRVPFRAFVFPLTVVVGTVVVLVAVPGAPGNAARHRAAHAAPLLIVLAAGLWPAQPSRSPLLLLAGAQRAASSPTIATAPASSRRRSAR